jgi:hypothetical protein
VTHNNGPGDSPRRPSTSPPQPAPIARTFVPAHLSCASGVVEGYLERLTLTGAVIRSLDRLPAGAEACELELLYPVGTACARGRVRAVDRELRLVEVELTHLDTNGRLLLATALMEAGLDDSA